MVNIQMILGLTRDLSNDTYGIVDPNQQTIFDSFQRDVYKIQKNYWFYMVMAR
jgi:hypothetical protein